MWRRPLQQVMSREEAAMTLRALARGLRLDRWFFTLAYWRRRTPWDTNITPPELTRLVEDGDPERLPAGRALDLGCGTGTNCLYLARHGWDVTGIDFAALAVARARAKAAQGGLLSGSVRFLQGDVTRLEALDLRPGYQLAIDLGCFHGIAPARRADYAAGVTRLAAPGALLMIYAFAPIPMFGRVVGVTADELRATFAPAWTVARIETGEGRAGLPSAWYWLRRAG
jgi:SAM-dependent methyltransferase